MLQILDTMSLFVLAPFNNFWEKRFRISGHVSRFGEIILKNNLNNNRYIWESLAFEIGSCAFVKYQPDMNEWRKKGNECLNREYPESYAW